MKQGWEIKKLEEVCDIINGRNQKMVECVDGAYPIYGSGGIMGYASQFLCKAGTTIIGRKGTINKPIYVEEPFWNVDTAFGFQPKSALNSKLLYYFCLHFDFLKLNKGTTIPSLVKADLLQIDMPYTPSIAEQQRIVEILDREFEKIDALKANAERSLQQAKDLFQSALKQELQPKEGWDISTLGDVCDIQGGSTPKRTEKAFWDNGTYPWFTVEDIREQGRIITNTKQKITKLAWDKLRVFPKNTVLLCCTASLGEYALTKIPLTSNQQFNGLSIKDENMLNPMYLLHYCSTLKDKLFTLSGKTTIDFVATGKVKQIEISFPSLVEQGKVVARLDKLKEHCTALEENYKKTIAMCDDMKHALLRQAFNGEL